jgi:hypothetical protein
MRFTCSHVTPQCHSAEKGGKEKKKEQKKISSLAVMSRCILPRNHKKNVHLLTSLSLITLPFS